jgi:hypothetical protein
LKAVLTILNIVNNTNNLVLRHDNDGEADSKITFKVLRAVKIQGRNLDSKKSLLIPIDFPGLSKPSNGYLLLQGVPGANRRRNPQKIIARATLPVDLLPRLTNTLRKSSAPVLKIMKVRELTWTRSS